MNKEKRLMMSEEEIKPIGIATADIYLHFPFITKDEADDLAEFLEEEHIEYKVATDLFEKLEQQNKKYKEVIDNVSNQIKLYGRYNGEKCTRGFSMMIADFNKLLDILKEVK